MDKLDCYHRCRDLMDEFGLEDWNLRFSQRKTKLGTTNINGYIEISEPLIEVNDWKVYNNTIRHEIAHALLGNRMIEIGHGPEWKRMAVRVGATPAHADFNSNHVAFRYLGECPSCGHHVGQHRKSKRMGTTACRKCCNRHSGGKFDPKFLFDWVDTRTSTMLGF